MLTLSSFKMRGTYFVLPTRSWDGSDQIHYPQALIKPGVHHHLINILLGVGNKWLKWKSITWQITPNIILFENPKNKNLGFLDRYIALNYKQNKVIYSKEGHLHFSLLKTIEITPPPLKISTMVCPFLPAGVVLETAKYGSSLAGKMSNWCFSWWRWWVG